MWPATSEPRNGESSPSFCPIGWMESEALRLAPSALAPLDDRMLEMSIEVSYGHVNILGYFTPLGRSPVGARCRPETPTLRYQALLAAIPVLLRSTTSRQRDVAYRRFFCLTEESRYGLLDRRGGWYSTRVTFTIELERDTDGRWLAEVPALPGVLCYGEDRDDAVARVQALALRVIAERLENREAPPEFLNVTFEAA